MTKSINLTKKTSKLMRVPKELEAEIKKIQDLVLAEFKKKHNIMYRPTGTQALRIYVQANSCPDKYLKITKNRKSIVLEKR